MSQKKSSIFRNNYDYEEDDYDRLSNIKKSSNPYQVFTNKATRKKFEFDYEEDAYEPEKNENLDI